MEYIGITEAKAHFSSIIERAMAGEEFIITKMGKPAAKIGVPKEEKKKKSLFGLFKEGEIKVTPDWEKWDEEEARALGIID